MANPPSVPNAQLPGAVLSAMLAVCLLVSSAAADDSLVGLVRTHCLECHQGDSSAAGVKLDDALKTVTLHSAKRVVLWERALRKVRTRQMPPVGEVRPTESQYSRLEIELAGLLDRWAEEHPNAGRPEALRRLTRTEYQNAIRDLLHLEVDASQWLPADETSHGFDNITVGELSPTLLSRYVLAAQKISRLAMGGKDRTTGGQTFRVPADRTQEKHVMGLPLGTRGGTQIKCNFPRDGEYEIQVNLSRDRNEHVEGLRGAHEMVWLLDRERIADFRISAPSDENHSLVDAHLKKRISVKAGPHQLGITFLAKSTSLIQTKRQPYDAHYNFHRHPRQSPAVFQVSIAGPFGESKVGATPSRQRLQLPTETEKTLSTADEAREILSPVVRRAYRRPVDDVDLERAMKFFQDGKASGGFEQGLELALTSILVNPRFLFRVEREDADQATDEGSRKGSDKGSVARVGDFELASRLSFFLWSSLPDDELLDVAASGRLTDRAELERQTRRMLLDPRSSALVTNFATQWLGLRRLKAFTPNLRQFPDFDDNLRQSFRRETELFLHSVFDNDRSVLELLSADYTFLNERLARHYRIPHVLGSRFRRVNLNGAGPMASKRGGLLRQGSILAVTSYATRTSPVLRGNWVLENIIGSPAPPPPADVPDLSDNVVGAELPLRQRLATHRENEACAGCHNLMDPIGFALENFDAIGRWRDSEHGLPIDVTGSLPNGSTFDGVEQLEQSLVKQPDWFVTALSEKLLTYALGRGLQAADGAAVRRIVRQAKDQDFRFSSLIFGVVDSLPFRHRSLR